MGLCLRFQATKEWALVFCPAMGGKLDNEKRPPARRSGLRSTWLETHRCSGVQGDADQRAQQWPPRNDSSCWHDRTGSCNRPKALLDEALSDSITSSDPIMFSSWKYRFPLALVGLGGDLITVFVA